MTIEDVLFGVFGVIALGGGVWMAWYAIVQLRRGNVKGGRR